MSTETNETPAPPPVVVPAKKGAGKKAAAVAPAPLPSEVVSGPRVETKSGRKLVAITVADTPPPPPPVPLGEVRTYADIARAYYESVTGEDFGLLGLNDQAEWYRRAINAQGGAQ